MKSVIHQLAGITGSISIANGVATLPDGTTLDLKQTPQCLVVVDINSGAVHQVRSSMEARVVILDQDTEGGDADRIMTIDGAEVFVHDYTMSEIHGEGIDLEGVQLVIDQIDSAQT